MEKTPKNHFFNSILSLILVLFPSLCLAWFLGFGLIITPILITFPILILSTIFFMTKKIMITLDENPSGISLEKEVITKTQVVEEFEKLKRYDFYEPSLESISENGQIHYEEESEGSSVDSEKSQSFELNWICTSSSSTNVEQDFSISDSSFSDEDDYGEEEDYDNLIEINLPERDSSDLKEVEENESKQKLESKQGLMDLLGDINEMNEEENLIEIDISMGSIKCTRFEIKA
ncbi:hypothetical protein CsatB_013363 [Cannabis sativa]